MHLAALEQLAAGEGALSLPEGVEAVCRGGVLTLRMAETAPEETVLRRGENPYGAGCLVVSRSPMEGALALRCGAEQRLTARCWRREDRLTLPDGRGARSLKRLMAERGVRPENRPENTGAVCGRRGRRRVGYRRGQELPAGAIRPRAYIIL